MLSKSILTSQQLTKRFLSSESKNLILTKSKRYMQTIPISTSTSLPPSFIKSSTAPSSINEITQKPRELKKHSLSFSEQSNQQSQPIRRSRTSRFNTKEKDGIINITSDPEIQKASSKIIPETKPITTTTTETQPKKKRTLRPRKALITLSPNAISHLKQLLNQPQPKLIRIGVRNRGCSGLTYNLEYVDSPGKFDETVEQDGVKVLIDSKALFSIVGSEMDWLDDKLSSRFIFKNPNSKGTCGCGESFMV
ncbi:unnamed protein product [Candida verbasci]|uniref:Iron-sulfur assembly protein 1 n=1 Tax=Candida verbasci TaxID=1227364 RepID=A0A9W4XCE2_9ASCO|nr:unnamed protein product [Candida verbasci]